MAAVNESESSGTTANSANCVDRDEFNNWLINKVSRQSTMISRAYGEKIIQYLRELREHGPDNQEMKAKFQSAFRFQVKKRKFQLINVVGLGDILCLPIKDKTKGSHAMLGQHRQVIFKEDMFDVIDNAHKSDEKEDRHKGYKGTFRKINATYCNIPREVVHKYVTMCEFCRKHHACFVPSKKPKKADDSSTNSKKKAVKAKPKKKEIEMTFLTRCQIDILDLQSLQDNTNEFQYIGHFLDHHTKYNVLFPLKRTDAVYVAKKLCRYVFNHFGLPHILHSNLGRKYVDEIITWVLQFWSTDAQIVNGNPRLKKYSAVVQQRQKTIMILIETIRAKQTDNNDWSAWLPGIQYSLNTNQFETESAPSYDVVFNRRPKVYTYAPCEKEIPREEDVLIEKNNEEANDDTAMDEVITVAVSDLIQQGANPMIVSQLSTDATSSLHDDTTDLEQTNNVDTVDKETTENMSQTLLHSASLTSIPYSLNNQYVLNIDSNATPLTVDSNSTTLDVGSHTLEITYTPTLNLDGQNTITVSEGDQGTSSMVEIVESADRSMLQQLTGESSLNLNNRGQLELSSNNVPINLSKDDRTTFSMKQIESSEIDQLQDDVMTDNTF